ncbi:MAG: hypothetical protein OHK0022_12800 [Roseiflexaceae bacterium]
METLLASPFTVLLLIGFAMLALRGPYRHDPPITYIPVQAYEPRPSGCLPMILGAALTLLGLAFLFGLLSP